MTLSTKTRETTKEKGIHSPDNKGSKRTYREKLFIDATPDGNYALRILRAYRAECDVKWTDNTAGLKLSNPILETLNELQEKRAKELDLAIKKLI